jgi:hypothetical protein
MGGWGGEGEGIIGWVFMWLSIYNISSGLFLFIFICVVHCFFFFFFLNIFLSKTQKQTPENGETTESPKDVCITIYIYITNYPQTLHFSKTVVPATIMEDVDHGEMDPGRMPYAFRSAESSSNVFLYTCYFILCVCVVIIVWVVYIIFFTTPAHQCLYYYYYCYYYYYYYLSVPSFDLANELDRDVVTHHLHVRFGRRGPPQPSPPSFSPTRFTPANTSTPVPHHHHSS